MTHKRTPATPESGPSLDDVEIASIESFPASDPPSWTPIELAPAGLPEHDAEEEPGSDPRHPVPTTDEPGPESTTSR